MCTQLCIILIFKLPREHIYRGLKNNNNNRAIHIVFGLRLGANICEPQQCPCGAPVDARGLHGLSCRGSNGRSARHHNLNDLVWRAMAKADIPALKEPSGLLITDGKRPSGVTLLPLKQGTSH